MTKRIATELDALAAPAGDGEILVWPEASALLRLAEENQRQRASYRFDLLGRPAQTWMRRPERSAPVLATGHQPAFFHPGVWAKHVAACEIAARLGGEAEFLVVDSDAVHDVALRWPEEVSGHYRVREVPPTSEMKHGSFDRLPLVPVEHWRSVFAKAPAAMAHLPETALLSFAEAFAGPTGSGTEPEVGYVARWIRGLAAVDRRLELPPARLTLVSELFGRGSARDGGAAASFIAHLLLHAGGFATAYNQALETYRRRRGIRGRQHPIPDLHRDGDRVELPLWLVHEHRPRQRLAISPDGRDGLRLWAGSESIAELNSRRLRSEPVDGLMDGLGGWEIMPRALTLTMFARLFLCDLFIHGIGGAKYDQITDDIIRRFFGIEPPPYACISATLWMPLRAHDVTESDATSRRHRLRDVRYNPHRYLSAESDRHGTAALIAERKRAIDESDRLKREARRDRAARRKAFERIRRANEAMLQAAPGLVEDLHKAWVSVNEQVEHNRVARSRDWFFALYPIVRLQALRESLPFCKHRVMS